MKSAIGNSLLMSIAVTIMLVVIILFVSVIAYSKAYKIKNKIIEIIEKNEGYITVVDENGKNPMEEEINSFLYKSGYKTGNYNNCSGVLADKEVNSIVHDGGFNYCVGEKTLDDGSKYYVVITFVEFNFPLVGSISPITVSGETKILGRNYE